VPTILSLLEELLEESSEPPQEFKEIAITTANNRVIVFFIINLLSLEIQRFHFY
jgi:hypothetical protein